MRITEEQYAALLARPRAISRKDMEAKRSKESGAYFEKIITSACETYSRYGIARIEKQQEPVKMIRPADRSGRFVACYTQRAGVDYKGTLKGGRSVVFEAKHTDTGKILKTRLQPWQHDYLAEHERLGATAFILLSFQMENYYRIPLDAWDRMKEIFGRQYLKEEDLGEYRIKPKGLFVDFLSGYYDEDALPPLLR